MFLVIHTHRYVYLYVYASIVVLKLNNIQRFYVRGLMYVFLYIDLCMHKRARIQLSVG